MQAPGRIRDMATAAAPSLNYGTRIDEKSGGSEDEPGVPKSGLARPAGVCTHWFAEQERIDPVAFGEWHDESQPNGLRDEVSDEMTCADIIAVG